MKRIWPILLLALMLSGCKAEIGIKPDTIVDIPLHPTVAQTQAPTEITAAPTEVPGETEPVTEMTEPATEMTEPAESPTKPSGDPGSSGGKKPGKDEGSTKPLTTEPSTQPPTEAPTEPPTAPPTEQPTEPTTEAPAEPTTEAPTQPPAQYDPSGYTPGSLDYGITDAVNRYRQDAGLTPLTLDPRLCAIASVRAYEITIDWDHNRPDGTAGTSVLNQYGYAFGSAAENLFYGFGSADAIVEKWMGSGSHKEKVLMGSTTAIGVGTYVSDDGLIYVAALFVGP